jgi:predicted TIM-barrel fold metal-dependent hydrolase
MVTMPDNNPDQKKPKAEQNDPKGPVIESRKGDLLCGGIHVVSVYRPSVIVDAHMHIQSGNCATLPFIWDVPPTPIKQISAGMGANRWVVEWPGRIITYGLDLLCEPFMAPGRAVARELSDKPADPDEGFFRTSPVRQLLNIQEKTTPEIAADFIAERETVYQKYFKTLPEYAPLSHLALTSVVMTMDMEYAQLDGYFGLKIYNAIYADEDLQKDPKRYWYPKHGFWRQLRHGRTETYELVEGEPNGDPGQDRTETQFEEYKKTTTDFGIRGAYRAADGQNRTMRIQAAPVVTPERETKRYERWQKQLQYTEQAMLEHPLKLLPMFHYDPRRWQLHPNGNQEVYDKVGEKGLYLGFKMYTAQGYRPWDIRRLPTLEDFYAQCARQATPILNHCTPKGAATVEKELYYDFVHPNDTAEDQRDKDRSRDAVTPKSSVIQLQATYGYVPNYSKAIKQAYFNEHFVSPKAWRKVLEGKAKGQSLGQLHLCLAHFGGPTELGLEWSEQTIEMMREFPNLYADISSSFASGAFRQHFKNLMEQHTHRDLLRQRILFGTDWYLTLLYTKPFHGWNFWKYCVSTKTFLDKFDTSLWPRFTMHNPYKFYRLNDERQIMRIARNIIARSQTEVAGKNSAKLEPEEINLIMKEAAWIRQANDAFKNFEETPC